MKRLTIEEILSEQKDDKNEWVVGGLKVKGKEEAVMREQKTEGRWR
jgi:hypothetical protein